MISGYLDPASGSAIVGAVAAGAAGAGVAARTMMAKMRLRKRGAAPADGEQEMLAEDEPAADVADAETTQ